MVRTAVEEVRYNILTADNQVSSFAGELPQVFLKFLGECAETHAALSVADNGGFLLAEDEVDYPEVRELYSAVLDGTGAAGDKSTVGGCKCLAVKCRIVEAVAGYDLSGVVAAASSERFPGSAAELSLMAGERDILDVRHAEIIFAVEAGATPFAEMTRTAHAVESVDNQHRLHILTGLAEGKGLRRECLASGVDRDYSEGMDLVIVGLDVEVRAVGLADLVEPEVSLRALHDNVPVGHGGGLERIRSRLPTQPVMVLLCAFYCEILHGERLNHELAVLALGKEPGDALVYGASYRKTERRVETIPHIGEVLMAHKLDKRCGHFRHACLDI